MLDFKSFAYTVSILAGIELCRMIRKGHNVLQGTLSSYNNLMPLQHSYV
jgi:hypothetical protein